MLRRRDREVFAMKVIVIRTEAALEDARRERDVLSLGIPGCLSLIDYHEEVTDDDTGVVFVIMPCVPSSGSAPQTRSPCIAQLEQIEQ